MDGLMHSKRLTERQACCSDCSNQASQQRSSIDLIWFAIIRRVELCTRCIGNMEYNNSTGGRIREGKPQAERNDDHTSRERRKVSRSRSHDRQSKRKQTRRKSRSDSDSYSSYSYSYSSSDYSSRDHSPLRSMIHEVK